VRDAAGTLIENVAKATRRKQIQLSADGTALSDEYLDKLFKEVAQLYKLSEIEVKEPETQEPAATDPDGSQAAEPATKSPEGGKTPETTKAADKKDLGPLPSTSVWLLGLLAGAWVLIGAAALLQWIKKRKEQKNH
jgi:hypothetical protein